MLIIKPTRCTNFSNLFLEWKSTCFGQSFCPSFGVFHCTHSNGICHRGLLTACEQDQNGTAVPSWSCSQVVSTPVWHIPLLCVQWKIPDDGQRNCPKHVEFYSKNKFEKLVHLVGFIIRINHDARLPERQIGADASEGLSSSIFSVEVPYPRKPMLILSHENPSLTFIIINTNSLCITVVSPAAHLRDISKCILGNYILSLDSELLH